MMGNGPQFIGADRPKMGSVSPRRDNAVIFTVGTATLLSSMSNSVANTILPSMLSALRVPLAQGSVVILIYLVVLSALLIPVGRMADPWGMRRMFLTGFVVFALGSSITALSQGYVMALLGRAVAGVGAALLLATGPAILSRTFPVELRGRVLGWQAMMTYIGLAIGPAVGGWATQMWSWHAAFWIAIPIALLGGTVGYWSVERGLAQGLSSASDSPRILMMGSYVVATAAIIMSANTAAGIARWAQGVMFFGGIIALSVVVKLDGVARVPLLDFRLYRHPNYRWGISATIANYMCFFIPLFVLPVYLTVDKHWPPGWIGTLMTVMPAVMTVVAPVAGRLSDRWGSRLLSLWGMVANGLGLGLFAFAGWQPDWHDLVVIIGGLVVTGLGIGLFAAPNNAAILKSAPLSKQGIASGTLATARYVGMMGGLILARRLWSLTVSHMGLSFGQGLAWVMAMGMVVAALGIWVTALMQN